MNKKVNKRHLGGLGLNVKHYLLQTSRFAFHHPDYDVVAWRGKTNELIKHKVYERERNSLSR